MKRFPQFAGTRGKRAKEGPRPPGNAPRLSLRRVTRMSRLHAYHSVELDNIKSYRRASIPFAAGTAPCVGTTARASPRWWRRSASRSSTRSATARSSSSARANATALSPSPSSPRWMSREYQVVRRCGSSATWYVHDPEIGGRVVEQRQDVLDFLRRHLRIETDIKLSDLFTDALGVPQGTFTADFLLTPANRKKKFDTLLQVEDYRKAAERLNETRNYLIEQRRGVEMRHRRSGARDGAARRLARAAIAARSSAKARSSSTCGRSRPRRRGWRRGRGAARAAGWRSRGWRARRSGRGGGAPSRGRLRDAETAARARRARRSCLRGGAPDHAAHLAAQRQLEAATARAGERDAWRSSGRGGAAARGCGPRSASRAHATGGGAGSGQRLAELTPQ